jgi:proteic killer suppression protein
MIGSFKHKGLRDFFNSGSKKGINPAHAEKLETRLDRLNASAGSEDMRLPGYQLHELSGREKGTFAISVSGAWRMTFTFDGGDAMDVDYRQYH